jgi:predicted nuclease of restriction endonuclease-like (RecB) superfamily
MNSLYHQIKDLIHSARQSVVKTIDLIQVLTNFEIGRRIVTFEQNGNKRAEYGKNLLKNLSSKLTEEFGRGFSQRNLEYMRKFYLSYKDRDFSISQKSSAKFEKHIQPLSNTSELLEKMQSPISQKPSATFQPSIKERELLTNSQFVLSWSQYVFLIGIKNSEERQFYEIEALKNNWTVKELKRQFDSGLYERLALSRDKNGITKLSKEGQIVSNPTDLLKDPYILEFLELDEKTKYSESDLETAIIDKLEHFLLELGKGFLFEARQKRFTYGEDHFFVDLVFFNRLLRCYVLLDLKIGKLTHQDMGQMQMYVNYFDRYVKQKDENPTVGIILCKKKHDALIEITLPKDTHIHASEYQLYLPDKKLLKQRLMEWTQSME